MFGQLTVHACSQAPNGSSRMRVSSSSAATSTYGDQALARPIEPLSCATSRGWMEPVQSAGQFSRLSNSQHSSGLGTRNPARAAVTTMASPTRLPSSAGNSGPSR